MGSKFRVNSQIRGGFAVDEPLIRRTFGLAKAFCGDNPNISVTFKNGRSIKSTDCSDVFDDSSIRLHSIREIRISLYTIETEFDVTFSANSNRPITVYISGEKNNVYAIETELKNELTAARTWYSVAVIDQYVLNFSTTINILLLFSGIFIVIMLTKDEGYIQSNFSNRVIIAIIAISSILTPSMQLLFPPLIFDIGKGKNTYSFQKAVRNFLFFIVIAGVLVSVFGNIATNYILK